MSEMIPFGKYKGQPIEVLQNDPEYANWIAQQQWAKERHPQIVNIIINKFGESEETPDHNAMQAKFMDPRYCAMLAESLGAFIPEPASQVQAIADRIAGDRLRFPGDLFSSQRTHDKIDSLSELVHGQAFEAGAIDVSFEVRMAGVDIRYGGRYDYRVERFIATNRKSAAVEIKPIVGDDYPAILRQMRNNRSNILVYGTYNGIGVNEKTFRQFFEMQKIRVVKESEILFNADEREKNAIEKIKSAITEIEKIIFLRVTAGSTAKP